MSKKTNSLVSANPDVRQALEQLGLRLRANRVAVGWTVKEMASRLLCSQNTYRAIEAGKPSASIGIIANALWLFGQLDSLEAIAPAPLTASANSRARRRAVASDPALISETERDF